MIPPFSRASTFPGLYLFILLEVLWPFFLLVNFLLDIVDLMHDLYNCLEKYLTIVEIIMNLSSTQRTKDLDASELLEQLPAFQQLLFRVIGCQVTD